MALRKRVRGMLDARRQVHSGINLACRERHVYSQSMNKSDLTVAELSSLLRMLQVIPDADNVGRIHQMLLAFCTAWRTIGVRRAFLLQVDERARMLRGHLAAERAPGDDES